MESRRPAQSYFRSSTRQSTATPTASWRTARASACPNVMMFRDQPGDKREPHMRKAILPAILLFSFAVASHTPAHALLLHTWVASNGDNNASCDRSAPCATFAGAYNKTSAG